MQKPGIMVGLFMGVLMLSTAFAQEKPLSVKTVSGTVISSDEVGNIISIRTADLKQIAFFVPEKAVITQETHSIGLMDIRVASNVTIQYYVSASLKNIIVSIADNESVIND